MDDALPVYHSYYSSCIGMQCLFADMDYCGEWCAMVPSLMFFILYQVLSRPVTVRQLGATIREPNYIESEFRVSNVHHDDDVSFSSEKIFF